MLGKIESLALRGLDGCLIDVEVDINRGLPGVEVVGLPDSAVKESMDRVRSAVKHSGYLFPVKKITVNLAPADIKKEGANYDLPIAIGVLAASEQITEKAYKDYVFLGELSLDGTVRGINGVLPLLLAGRAENKLKYIIPYSNAEEAGFVEGLTVYAVSNLKEAVEFLNGEKEMQPIPNTKYEPVLESNAFPVDFSEIKGQSTAKRALEIAVAGGHNILMVGPQGSGKTMLAKAVLSIMPPCSFDEAIEITKIHSVSGVLDSKKGIVGIRPFRSPHHTASTPAMVGGGMKSKPGEISLAHYGVLFLDELPEYKRETLEALRQPLEDGVVTVTRVAQTTTYPARFMLVASMNPCPCGNYGSKLGACVCTARQIHNYQNKLSGPLLDRIDLKLQVDNISYDEYKGVVDAESSEVVRNRVIEARNIQKLRYINDGIMTNAEMNSRLVKKYCALDSSGEKLLELAFTRLKLSARGVTRILKVARTIADLAGSEKVQASHLSEAIQYRTYDLKQVRNE